jgi:hypothetical protein
MFGGAQPRSHDEDGKREKHENDEGADSNRPSERDVFDVEQSVENDGKDDASQGRSGDDDAHRHAALLVKVVRHDGEGGTEEKTDADSAENGLGEEELIVLRTEAREDDGEDVSDRARDEELRVSAAERQEHMDVLQLCRIGQTTGH